MNDWTDEPLAASAPTDRKAASGREKEGGIVTGRQAGLRVEAGETGPTRMGRKDDGRSAADHREGLWAGSRRASGAGPGPVRTRPKHANVDAHNFNRLTARWREVTENDKAWDKVPPMPVVADGRAQDTERVAVGETSSEWPDPSIGRAPLPSGSVAEGGEGSGAKRGL